MKKPLVALLESILVFFLIASAVLTVGELVATCGGPHWMTLARAWDIAAWILALVWVCGDWEKARAEERRRQGR